MPPGMGGGPPMPPGMGGGPPMPPGMGGGPPMPPGMGGGPPMPPGMGGMPPPPGGPPMPGMGMPMMAAPVLNLIKLNKPELKPSKKIKAFVWKRVILDRQGGSNNVANNDLRSLDPNWKGKTVVWKDVKEEKFISLEMIEEMFSDKTKKIVAKVVDSGKVDLNKPKTFFDSSKG
jgi:hypothetical protein